MRRKKYWIRYTSWDPKLRRRRRVEEKTEAKSYKEARDLLNERLGATARGETPAAVSKVKLGELYADLRADYVNKGQNVDDLVGSWKHVEDFFGPDALVKTITHPRLQQYVDLRRSDGAKPATIRKELAVLRRMLRLGYGHRKVAQLPVFPTIAVQNARVVFFEDDEFDRLLAALPEVAERDVGNDWLIPFVITARWIGTRRNELLRLERRQLDLAAGKVTLDVGSTKNREGRIAYLPPEALAALREWDEKTRALERERGVIVRWVFHRRGERIRHFPYELWHKAVTQAKIAGRRIPHDFRRTTARTYRRAGVSEGVIMQLAGWKTRSVFERYNIKNEKDLQEAAAAVRRNGAGNGAQASINPISTK
jgi:integrase